MQDTRKPVGEIVQASTIEFVAQCHTLYIAPPLGTLIRCRDENPVYGVVCDVSTQSIDPGRRPIAMGQDETSEEDVYLGNPQLIRLLTTELRILVVGHRANDQVNAYLAPQPPKIHSFVYECEQDEVFEFSQSLHYLPVLLASPIGSPDDVTASFVRRASLAHPDPSLFLVDAGKELAFLLGDQLNRLNVLLRKISS